MKIRKTAVLALALMGVQSQGFAGAKSGLVVHEWGTFTSLQGSNGEVQEGMHHEEETLPAFVHGRDPLHEERIEPRPRPRPTPPPCRGKCMELVPTPEAGLAVTQKMETPVLYFYSPEPMKVRVDVGFPQGIISQYFPKPVDFSPAIGSIKSLSGGSVRFEVDVVTGTLPLPYASPRSVYAPARQVASNFIRSGNENEKLIFYRGLGNFRTNLQVQSQGGNLAIVNRDADSIRGAFLVNVTATGGSIAALGNLRGSSTTEVPSSTVERLKQQTQATARFLRQADQLLTEALRDSGLRPDEAQSMANTWKASYFQSPGLRLLYVLSRTETDQILPITVTPAPQELIRTLVGRVEILLDTDEAAILEQIRREKDGFQPVSLGRFSEPKLRRVMHLPGVTFEERSLIQRLIAQLPK